MAKNAEKVWPTHAAVTVRTKTYFRACGFSPVSTLPLESKENLYIKLIRLRAQNIENRQMQLLADLAAQLIRKHSEAIVAKAKAAEPSLQ